MIGHRTTRYLNTNKQFKSLCPELLQRIVELGEAVDSVHFHLIRGESTDVAVHSSVVDPAGQYGNQGTAGGVVCAAASARKARVTKFADAEDQPQAYAADDTSKLCDNQVVPASLAPRCVEYHTMVGGAEGLASCGTGSLGNATDDTPPVPLHTAVKTAHYDQGSVLTVDIMLADTAEFEGGRLSTLEADGECKHHAFEQGDALVFVSHKYQ